MTETCDFLVVGGGIAGASAAYFLAEHGAVVVLERESAPGYHATGRSAALYTINFGPPVIRKLVAASGAFFADPPPGFAEHPLTAPRGALTFAQPGQEEALAALLDEFRSFDEGVQGLDAGETRTRCPFLRPEQVIGAVYESAVRDLDVHALLTGFLKGLRTRGGRVATDAEVVALERGADGLWRAETRGGDAFAAPVVVNAAGAWADEIAALAGVAPIGLVPKRRTALTFDAPPGLDVEKLPLVGDLDDSLYLKPEGGRLMASPSDATPSPPCDAQPEEIDIAITIDRVERLTTLPVGRIAHRWAGLRSFVADGLPVVGMAPGTDGFLWLAGQGGYGIESSPAMARIAAALATRRPFPAEIEDRGVSPAALAPDRCAAAGAGAAGPGESLETPSPGTA